MNISQHRADILPSRWRLIVGISALTAFLALATSVAIGAPFVDAYDAALQAITFPLRTNDLTPALASATNLADTFASLILATAFVVYLFARIGKHEAMTYAACVLVGEACVVLTKIVVNRTRPIGMNLIEFPADASFPSGHTFAAIAIVSFGVFVLLRVHPNMPRIAKGLLVALAIIWPLFIAFTRIYLGAHWPTDVAGSLLLGAGAFLPLSTFLWDRLCWCQTTI